MVGCCIDLADSITIKELSKFTTSKCGTVIRDNHFRDAMCGKHRS